MLERLELADFEPLKGDRFELRLADTPPLELELVEASQVGELSARQARELGKRLPFSLVFRGPAELELDQAIRTLSHRELGELELFLVPIDRGAEGSLFEAVFT